VNIDKKFMENIQIRHIFYDKETLSQTPSSFIPLDNIDGDKSWYEFWPILNFLKNTKLEENVFYGFLSPRFTFKTNFPAESVINAVRNNSDKDVVLFSFAWDQLSYFINPWEQGEVWHPGITKVTQNFLNHLKLEINILNLITSRKNSVFSNYVVAKKSYWDRWKVLASQFLTYADSFNAEIQSLKTGYIKNKTEVSMKVFVQERLPALILTDKNLSTVNIDVNKDITAPFFIDSPENKYRIEECDCIKNHIIETGPSKLLLDEFINARNRVLLKK